MQWVGARVKRGRARCSRQQQDGRGTQQARASAQKQQPSTCRRQQSTHRLPPSGGGSALLRPTSRNDSATPCTNSVVCLGSGCTASDSLTTFIESGRGRWGGLGKPLGPRCWVGMLCSSKKMHIPLRTRHAC